MVSAAINAFVTAMNGFFTRQDAAMADLQQDLDALDALTPPKSPPPGA